jgi:signal transduction histidine kinase
MKDDDLYLRYQTLAALIGVLLHDLRNPLHSGTLLVEAMGSRTADVNALRGKLRGQLGKLEGLISEASEAIKELGLEARIEDISIDDLLRSAATSAPALAGCDIELVLPSTTGLSVTVDPTLLVRAIAEIGATLFERSHRTKIAGGPEAAPSNTKGGRTTIALRVDQPDAGNVRLVVGDWVAQLDEAAVKAPFTISGGGIRVALARTLSQIAGATLRLEQSQEAAIRYALYLRCAA